MCEPIAALFGSGAVRRLAAGETLFRTRDPVLHMALVRSGRIDLVRHSGEGARMILQRAGPGAVVAEASAYAPAYHCDAVAQVETEAVLTPLAAFRDALARDPGVAEAWTAHLARAVQAARLAAEIRTLRTVADRLDAWLDAGGQLPPRGTRQEVAAQLGVTREALYRELARRRP